jgi:hypothetical protein
MLPPVVTLELIAPHGRSEPSLARDSLDRIPQRLRPPSKRLFDLLPLRLRPRVGGLVVWLEVDGLWP